MSAVVKMPVASVKMAASGIDAHDAGVDLTLTSAPGGWPLTARGQIVAGAVSLPGREVRGAKLTIDASAPSLLSFGGKVGVDVDDVAMAGLKVTSAHVDADLHDIRLQQVTLESSGSVKLTGKVGVVAAAGKGARGVTFASTVQLNGKKPASASLQVDAVDVTPGVPNVPGGALHLDVDAPEIAINSAEPGKSVVGNAHIKASLGANSIAGTIAGSATPLAASWDVEASVDRAGPAKGVKLASKGRFGGEIEHDTTIDVGRVAMSSMSLRSAHVHIASKGTLRHQDATIAATLDGVNMQGKDLGSPKLDLAAVVDLDKSHADLHLRASSPGADVHLVADVDAARVVHYQLDGKIGQLGPLVAYLPPGPDWSQLTVGVKGQGAIGGVVRSIDNGVPVMVADPMISARGKAHLDVDVGGVHYRGADATASDVESITVRADAELGDTRKLTLDVAAPLLEATASGVKVGIKTLAIHLDANLDKHGVGETTLSVRAASLSQSAVALVPVRDLDLEVKLAGDPATSMTMTARFANPGSGTTFDLSGQLDRRVAGADAIPESQQPPHARGSTRSIAGSAERRSGPRARDRQGEHSVPRRVGRPLDVPGERAAEARQGHGRPAGAEDPRRRGGRGHPDPRGDRAHVGGDASGRARRTRDLPAASLRRPAAIFRDRGLPVDRGDPRRPGEPRADRGEHPHRSRRPGARSARGERAGRQDHRAVSRRGRGAGHGAVIPRQGHRDSPGDGGCPRRAPRSR